MWKQKIERVLAAVLSASILMTNYAFASFDSGFTYSYPIADGTTYSRSEGKNSAGMQKANIITYSPNSTVTPIISYSSDKLYNSSSTILSAANYLANAGYSVVGGVNADFFVMSTGIPIGLVIDEGELISSDAWQYAVGFQSDGSTVLGQPTMSMKVTGSSGTTSVSYFNKTRTTAGIYLLDSNYDNSSHFSANGKNIILERIDDSPVTVNGSVKLKVINKGTGSSAITITDNQMVLTQSDGAAGDWVDFAVGEEVTLSVYASNSEWQSVQYAVGGKLLISNGTVSTSGIDSGSSKTARTAVGTKADGSLVLYEVDGLQSSSAGLTAAELAEQMLSLGCTNAICLDGGGSSAMALSQPGASDVSLISSPSGGAQRACANYIFLLNKASSDGVAHHAVLTPTYRYLLPGGSTTFTVAGADNAYKAAPAPSDLSYAVSNDLGTVSGNVFTAGSETGTATISASNNDGVDGYMMVCVTSAINEIALQSGGNAIGSISIGAEESIDIDALGYHLGEQMGTSDSAFTWMVTDGLGSVDANGVFTAGATAGSGTLTCSFGSVSKSLPVTVGMGEPQSASLVTDFETSTSYNVDGLTSSALTANTDVARGNQSLRLSGDASTGTLELPTTSVSDMNYVSLYARASSSGTLSAVFKTTDGNETTAAFSAAPGTGYALLNCSIPANASTLTGIRFETVSGSAYTLDLDHIVVSASYAITSTSSPAITLASTSLTVDTGASATISGSATMENGAAPVRSENFIVYVDGTKISGAVSRTGSSFTVSTGALSTGTHVVTVTVLDDAGNRAQASATVVAGSASSIFADTSGNWASGYAALLYTQGIMQGETSNGATYFRPTRNLTRMEFAVIMARVMNLDTSYSGSLSFADNASIPDWAKGSVYAVSQADIMNGSQVGSSLYFNPRNEITRAEVMTVIGRTLPRGFVSSSLPYTDTSKIPSWAEAEVKMCVQAGIISGYSDGTIKPLNSITRAEIAKILCVM